MKNFSTLLARVMIVGTLLAAIVIFAGMVWFLATHPGTAPGGHVFSGEPGYFRSPVAMFERAIDWGAEGERRAVIMLGVLLLLLGPIVRVALVAMGYALDRDRLYAGVGAFVFLVLLASFFW